jgi:hypothetical protein
MNQAVPPGFIDPTTNLAPVWYVGNQDDYIELDFALSTAGEVVLNSFLHLESRGVSETFLIEPWRRHEVLEQAVALVEDAKEYLKEEGFKLDNNKTPEKFITALRTALGITLQ